MDCFRQEILNTCDIVAIRHVLSFYGMRPSFAEIEKRLPRHDFGSWITEIGTYLESMGIKTRLVSNEGDPAPCEKEFLRSLDEYKKVGVFEDRTVSEREVGENPIIANIDIFKAHGKKGGPGAHYVVLLKNGKLLRMFDGDDFFGGRECSFEEILKASTDINEFYEEGMWLLTEGRKNKKSR